MNSEKWIDDLMERIAAELQKNPDNSVVFDSESAMQAYFREMARGLMINHLATRRR